MGWSWFDYARSATVLAQDEEHPEPHWMELALGRQIITLAQGLGNAVTERRGVLLLTAVGLAGASVAAAGTLGFVGLVPVAGAVGALIIVAADLAGRTLLAPTELPCGLITAAIGAPFFIYLLWRQRRTR